MGILFLAAVMVVVAIITAYAIPVRKYGKWARFGIVGEVLGGDLSTPVSGRQGKTGEAIVGTAHGKYYETASRGRMFAAADNGAGVTVQVTITTTATLTLHNPANSGKRLTLKKLSVAYFTGTLGAGAWYHAALPPGNTLPSGGTAPTVQCTDVGNQSGAAAVGVLRTGATVVSASGFILYPFASSMPILASSANNPFRLVEDIDGAIVLEPGAQYQLVGVFGGTGSSPKVAVGLLWEEVPIVATQG